MATFWVKIQINLIDDLPKNRPYTRLEAAYSVAVDRFSNKEVSLRGYARMWQWSTGKVARFLEEIINTADEESTIKNQQNNETEARQQRDNGETLKQIENNSLRMTTKQRRDSDGTEARHNYKEKEKRENVLLDFFETLWADYPQKEGSKKKAISRFKATVKNDTDCKRIRQALNNYLAILKRDQATGFNRRPQNGDTWFNNWQDWENISAQPITPTVGHAGTGNTLEELRAKGIDV